MEVQKGKWFLIQSEPNPFLSQYRDRSEKETGLDWDVRPVGEGVGTCEVGKHPISQSRLDKASLCFSFEEKAVGVGISPFVAGEYAMQGLKSQDQRQQK